MASKKKEKVLFIKGNEAYIYAAARAKCEAFFGYPITPSSEAAELAMWLFPEMGGIALQAESEASASFMLYGAAAAGRRAMTTTSGPGLVWMQDGLNYCATEELPCVVVDIQRGGPALGNICPGSADYRMVTRPGGNGDYNLIVFSASSVQELVDLTYMAFNVADNWRNPVVILGDGMLGQMAESVVLPPQIEELPEKPWAVTGTRGRKKVNKFVPFDLTALGMEAINLRLQAKYRQIKKAEVRYEKANLKGAQLLVVAHGIVGRVMQTVIENVAEEGMKVGLIRPISVWPFPSEAIDRAAKDIGNVLVIEASEGQMVDDVRLAVNGAAPVHFHGRSGGVVFGVKDLLKVVRDTYEVNTS